MAMKAQGIVLAVWVLLLLLFTVEASPLKRERRADDAGPLEAVVEGLSQQVTTLISEVATLKAKTDTLDRTVAFSASHDTNPLRVLSQGTLILNHVVTNVGNGYDSETGIFTAPVAGLYDVQATFMGYDVSHQDAVFIGIIVDGVEQARGISDNRHGTNYDQTSIRVIVHANAGSRISLKNPDSDDDTYYSSRTQSYLTFSGFLIKAD